MLTELNCNCHADGVSWFNDGESEIFDEGVECRDEGVTMLRDSSRDQLWKVCPERAEITIEGAVQLDWQHDQYYEDCSPAHSEDCQSLAQMSLTKISIYFNKVYTKTEPNFPVQYESFSKKEFLEWVSCVIQRQ